MSEIETPFPYFGDPTKSRALFNGKLYFGLPDTDPTIASNQKLVRAIQEDGTLVSLSQPISTNSGGYPTYNNSAVRLDVSGNYSFAALNRNDVPVYEASEVENLEPGSDGFSGVVVPETQTLAAAQTTVVFSIVGANESVFYLSSSIADEKPLIKGIHYTVTNSTTIELTSSYNAGDKVTGRQNDPTGQLVDVRPNRIQILVYEQLSDAQAAMVSGDLDVDDYVTLVNRDNTSDRLGEAIYQVKATGPANDGVTYLDLNGTNQLRARARRDRFKTYVEIIGQATLAAGNLEIDIEEGTTQEVTLDQNVTSISFINAVPDAAGTSYLSTVTLRIEQDGAGGHSVAWPASIKWNGGAAPTVTSTAGAYDLYGFVTYDAGTTWIGSTIGQNFS